MLRAASVVKNVYFQSSATLSVTTVTPMPSWPSWTWNLSSGRDYHGNQWWLDCHRGIKISTYYVYTPDLLQIFAEEHETTTKCGTWKQPRVHPQPVSTVLKLIVACYILFLLLFHLHPYAHCRCLAAQSNKIANKHHFTPAWVLPTPGKCLITQRQ